MHSISKSVVCVADADPLFFFDIDFHCCQRGQIKMRCRAVLLLWVADLFPAMCQESRPLPHTSLLGDTNHTEHAQGFALLPLPLRLLNEKFN